MVLLYQTYGGLPLFLNKSCVEEELFGLLHTHTHTHTHTHIHTHIHTPPYDHQKGIKRTHWRFFVSVLAAAKGDEVPLW